VSNLLRVESYEIPGGVTDPLRVRITLSDGRTGTYDYPDYIPGRIDAHEHCIARLFPDLFDRTESFYKVGESGSGYKWTIFLRPES
jgi:hypothetical protein